MNMFAYSINSTKFKVTSSTIKSISELDKSGTVSDGFQLMDYCSVHKISLQNSSTSKKQAEYIGKYAAASLLEEVNTSPKPGLVDRITNGAHQDMNLYTFYKSAEALEPYFSKMALIGVEQSEDLEKCFLKIREIGMEAEAAMYAATGGVNTHKGLIFSLGILCTCVGSCLANNMELTIDNIILTEQKMVRRILIEELEHMNQKASNFTRETHGEALFKKMGVTGVRGEAINGFATVREIGLPVMQDGLKQKKDFNLVKLQTLMTAMSRTEDTNVLSRTDEETLLETQEIAREYLEHGGAYGEDGLQKLLALDTYFTEKNISHGGCADLLAVTIFLVSITN